MKKYYAVEVTRTVTERRKIYVCAEDGDTAHDDALEAVKTPERNFVNPWVDPSSEYEVSKVTAIDQPDRVDVAV